MQERKRRQERKRKQKLKLLRAGEVGDYPISITGSFYPNNNQRTISTSDRGMATHSFTHSTCIHAFIHSCMHHWTHSLPTRISLSSGPTNFLRTKLNTVFGCPEERNLGNQINKASVPDQQPVGLRPAPPSPGQSPAIVSGSDSLYWLGAGTLTERLKLHPNLSPLSRHPGAPGTPGQHC